MENRQYHECLVTARFSAVFVLTPGTEKSRDDLQTFRIL